MQIVRIQAPAGVYPGCEALGRHQIARSVRLPPTHGSRVPPWARRPARYVRGDDEADRWVTWSFTEAVLRAVQVAPPCVDLVGFEGEGECAGVAGGLAGVLRPGDGQHAF
jgi:hypothetical protein